MAEDVTVEKVRDVWSQVVDMSNAERMSSITEATGSLVEVLDKLEGGTQSKGDETNNDIKDDFAFGNKDLILYALGGEFYI